MAQRRFIRILSYSSHQVSDFVFHSKQLEFETDFVWKHVFPIAVVALTTIISIGCWSICRYGFIATSMRQLTSLATVVTVANFDDNLARVTLLLFLHLWVWLSLALHYVAEPFLIGWLHAGVFVATIVTLGISAHVSYTAVTVFLILSWCCHRACICNRKVSIYLSFWSHTAMLMSLHSSGRSPRRSQLCKGFHPLDLLYSF